MALAAALVAAAALLPAQQPATADYTPFATKMKEAGPNWVYTSAPWVSQVRNFEALRRLY